MRVDARLGGDLISYEVVAGEAPEPDPSVVQGSVVARATPTGDPVCCEPHPASCDWGSSCFYETKLISAALTVYATDLLEAPASQWLFRVTVTAEGMDPKQGAWFPATSHADILLDVSRSSYCFTLEAESLKDGTQIEVKRDCLTNQVAFEEWTIPDIELTLELSDCSEPPPGHEDQWCEAYAYCAEQADGRLTNNAVCRDAREICDFPLTMDAAPDAGLGADSDAGQGGPLLDDARGDGSVCSLGNAPRGPRSLGTWFALLSVGLAWRRRTRGQGPCPASTP
jgi:MYXO-CTERM domain-containing protein